MMIKCVRENRGKSGQQFYETINFHSQTREFEAAENMMESSLKTTRNGEKSK